MSFFTLETAPVEHPVTGDRLVALPTVLAAVVGGLLAWWINRAADRRRAAAEGEMQILKTLEFLTGVPRVARLELEYWRACLRVCPERCSFRFRSTLSILASCCSSTS